MRRSITSLSGECYNRLNITSNERVGGTPVSLSLSKTWQSGECFDKLNMTSCLDYESSFPLSHNLL